MSKFNDKIIKAKTKASHQRNVVALALPKKYDHIDFTPPQGVIDAAKKGLDIRQEKPSSQKGGTAVGVARARDLSNGRQLTPDTIKRMFSYFSRHEVDKKSPNWDDWSKGKQAWYLWGGDAGFTWAKKVIGQMKKADEQVTALSERPKLTQGSPILALSIGKNYSRFDGKQVGSEITKEVLQEIVKTFKEKENTVIIDWEHSSSPFVNATASPPEVGKALGEIVDVYVDSLGENLYVVPNYTKKGVEIVQQSDGVLFPSPEFIVGDVFSKTSGKRVGGAALLALTLTPRPQQNENKIQRVLLSEKINRFKEFPMDPKELDGKSPEELKAMLLEKHNLVLDLENKVQELKSNYDKLKADHEAMMLELEQGSVSEAEPMMASPESNAMGEYKKSEMNAMSEKIAQELNAQIVALNEKIASLQKANHDAEKKMAVDALLQAGKITPSEVNVASQAYDAKASTPAFWNLFSERKPSTAVPLQVVGHTATGNEVNLLSEAKALQAQKNISFAQAINEIRTNRPDVYSNYYSK